MLISVTYDSDSETKGEIRDDENNILNYIEELLESDYHERFKIRVKKIQL